ncbi:MAG: hypothetical protein GEU75_14395 [Dehalococcoidia bacterium]|nr:hypothetical protein [Dehalococcoidia bacterium]
MPRNLTGLLIIRAWVEQGSSKPLRAHLRLTTDVADGFERELTLADVADVSAAVETWLLDVMDAGLLPDIDLTAVTPS